MTTATTAAPGTSTLPFTVALPSSRVEVRGAAWVEETDRGALPHRLPAWTRAQMPDDFMALCDTQPAGVRLRFRTAATSVALDVDVLRVAVDPQPPAAAQRWDVVVDGALVEQPRGCGVAAEAGTVELDPLRGTTVEHPGPPSTVRFVLPGNPEAAARTVEVWLPYGETVRLRGLSTDAPVQAPRPLPSSTRRWVHHGSSISHGAAADGPTGTWVVTAARAAGVDLVNLGFSGNAVLDPYVARAIRDQRADVVTLELGINVVNHDCFRRRTFAPAVHGFLDLVREGLPSTPVVVISPLLCPLVEDTPGPTSIDPDSPPGRPVFRTHGSPDEVADGKLTLQVVRDELAALVAARRAAGDEALHHVDGRGLYGDDDAAALPMADLMHPDPPAHAVIGERFARVLAALTR